MDIIHCRKTTHANKSSYTTHSNKRLLDIHPNTSDATQKYYQLHAQVSHRTNNKR